MVSFVGAGSGAPDLITMRGVNRLREADVVIYAGSLVNPELLHYTQADCAQYNSAGMTLEAVIATMVQAEEEGKKVVRLHTGDPSLYGAIGEQMAELDERGIAYEVVPGVSSFLAAAAALPVEFTVPSGSQSVILTRMEGRTPVPERESIRSLAQHRAAMAVFLSASMMGKLAEELIAGGYSQNTPVAIVYKASWPEEKVIRTDIAHMAEATANEKVFKTAQILIGDFLLPSQTRSKLYDPSFSHEYRSMEENTQDG